MMYLYERSYNDYAIDALIVSVRSIVPGPVFENKEFRYKVFKCLLKEGECPGERAFYYVIEKDYMIHKGFMLFRSITPKNNYGIFNIITLKEGRNIDPELALYLAFNFAAHLETTQGFRPWLYIREQAYHYIR